MAARNRAITAASIGSLLARLPGARAKARTWAGLTTMTGNPAPASAAATTLSNPPVASTAIAAGASPASLSFSAARPSPLRATAKASPDGATGTSSRSFDTSMPTNTASIPSRPCLSGLASRPRRLFGFDGTAGEAARSPTGSDTLRAFGLSPATAPEIIPDAGDPKLQGPG